MARENPQLGNLDKMLGVELRIAQILADRLFASSQHLKIAPGHYTVLSLIKLNPGINQSKLAHCMYLDRSSMVPILDQLEKKVWIERKRPPNDRRSHALYLTDAGSAALQQADEEVQKLEESIAVQMGHDNCASLLALIKQFQTALLKLQASEQSKETANDRKH
jgi:DNA-binding MarR family transcriptional regulator